MDKIFWCYILGHFLDNALAKTLIIISISFSECGFLYSRRSPRAGTFTKDLTKGRGINEWQRSGLIDIPKFQGWQSTGQYAY